MRLELDFDRKTITINDDVKVSDLLEKVKELKLENWTVQRSVEHSFSPTITFPQYPPYNPIWYDSGSLFCIGSTSSLTGDSNTQYHN